MLSAGGPGTGTLWTAMHRSPTDTLRNAQWRTATALRLGVPPDVGPGFTCALRKGNDGEVCGFSLRRDHYHPYCCKCGGARTRPHRAVLCTLQRLIEQAGGHADDERHVPELYDWDVPLGGTTPELRCAILDVVSWFPSVLQQHWIDVGVRCPHADQYHDSASRPGVAASAGEAEKAQRYGEAVRPLIYESYGRLGPRASSCYGTSWRLQPQTATAAHMANPTGAFDALCRS